MNDSTLDNLTEKFGKLLAKRIYAASYIQLEKLSDKAKDGEVIDLIDAIRYTIGMIKRMRRQSIEGGGNMSWANAVDRLEDEQMEGRHYVFKSAVGREAAKVAKVNSATYKVAKWSAMIEADAERVQAEYASKATEQVEASVWMHSFLESLSRKRLAWFTGVLAGLRRGVELTLRQRQAISNRYTPSGVKPEEFVELAIRYA